jgi:hypothetical protein
MADPIRPPTVREYFLMIGNLWGEEISGLILAFVSIVLTIACAPICRQCECNF